MANYSQPPYVTKRVRYYNNQLLVDQDFIDEQRYHVDRQRRQGRLLHVAGIAEGLAVAATADGKGVTVAPGTAIDAQGRQLLLDAPAALPLNPATGNRQTVYILYTEAESDPSAQGLGAAGNTRFKETPDLEVISRDSPLPDGALVLADVNLAAGGTVSAVDPGRRPYSGLRLAGPPGQDQAFSARADGSGAQLTGALSITGALSVAGTLSAAGTLSVAGALQLGSAAQPGSLLLGGVRSVLELGAGVADKEGNAGKLGFRLFSDSLDLVGAGPAQQRKVKIWAEQGTEFTGNLGLNDKTLYLRGLGDLYHGIGWRGGSQPFAGINLDGPAVFGHTGGALGTHNSDTSESIALYWNSGQVGIGTVGPGARLEVQGTTKDAAAAALKVTNSVGGWLFQVRNDGNVGIGAPDPGGKLDVRVPGAGNWDRFVVTTTPQWGDGNAQYVTIGAGGASGIMFSNPHVTWYDNRASIRYGRSGGAAAGAWWDVGTRGGDGFSFAVNDPGNHKLWLSSNGNIGIGTIGPVAKLDIQQAPRSGSHPASVRGLYVTGDFDEAGGAEFRHSNGTQGIGIGYDSIYATGTNPDQHLWLRARGGGGRVILQSAGINVFASGSTDEQLRIVRGTVNSNGAVLAGSNYSVNHVAGGLYDVYFNPPFGAVPTVVVTQIFNGDPNYGGGDTRDNAVIVGILPTRVRIKTGDGSGNASDRLFTFIAMGL